MRHSETYRAARREAAKRLFRGQPKTSGGFARFWFGINVPGKYWGRGLNRDATWGKFLPAAVLPLWRQKVYRPIARVLKGGALAWAARVQADNVAFARAMVRGNQPRR